MKKIGKSIITTILVSILVGSLVGCGNGTDKTSSGTKDDKKPSVVTIGYQQIPNDEILAKSKNWYEKELGVKVKFVQFDSGKDVNTAMTSKSLDIALLGSTPASIGISQNLPYEVFWIHDVIGKNEALVVKNKANINSIKDLKGKKVAVPFGSTTHYSLLSELKAEKVSANDVTVLDMQPQDIYAAWQRGEIDAAYVWEPTLAKLIALDGKEIINSGTLAEKGIVTGDIGIVNKDFAKKYPNIVTKYVKLQIKAYDYFKSNVDDAAQSVAKELNISKEDSKNQMNELIWLSAKEEISDKYLGTSSKKGEFAKTLKDTADFLVQQKQIQSAPELSEFEKAIDPEFIESALKK
ncbi:taurine ABC transporter substrate-binding protein [Clostridium luticellarii]|jgi:taurine transport system substrate-binding protein|uniref:taurine ABC transporter substrate-binding protein n=1 Tax=Clostridium luticellarii TaxID=1691940 RepID=UPI0023530601|nr:aliphatic sulfonate ABC transporter substrate-binding protein [Clostridium luticellarii]MCI1945356.1 aliphatic sulfonate ABC transporter substrate-binding protein [Clostridium luticellarii]MCI1968679.1 aliphatic sulfonate ABC transporter substrate-binding protein [Clostridium luticellarii]MCI1996795.1 aliphatic sulfonate ABC transporter substrate-binding protein [Clostridium luticellarii]MCI2040405.1 aliphatic sulfonate ABC transporter substrate-binding protein [Clostridium luticellarii]